MTQGYALTALGILPVDWEVSQIGQQCQIFGRIGFRGYTVNDIVDEGAGAIAINPSNVQDGKTTFDKCTYISWQKYEESPEIKIDEGDIILVKTGSTFGKTAIVKELPGKATLNPQVVVFKKIRIVSAFLGYMMGFPIIQNQIKAAVVGGALPTLSQRLVAAFKMPLPTRREEQQAIADALSDVDALLAGMDRLIAKKRDLKQAAMQQLLTGQTRLPGFQGKWAQTRLGQIAKIQRGASPRPIDSPVWFDENSSVGWVRISDVTRTGMFLDETTQRLSPLGVAHSRLVPSGSLIMSICATVGRPVITKIDVCIHDGFVVFDGLTPEQRFVYYVLKWLEPAWSKQGQTGSQMNLNTSLIDGAKISLPPRDEQVAIAAVLSDMDADLTGLEARRDKTRALKQGMMQELLTGRTRLV